MASEKQPWYRSPAATLTAGLVGLAIIAGLVTAVVQMSSRWSTPESETVVDPGQLPQPPQFAATTTSPTTSTSYPPVQLSTTDIGRPGEPTSSSETPDTEPSRVLPTDDVAPTFPGTFPTRVTHPPTPRTTRSGPRINVTRTLYPMP